MTVESIFKTVYQRISVGPRDPRRPIHIPHPNTDKPPPIAIVPQQDYVAIRVNQLFLVAARQWFTQIEPIVFASTEFLYDGKTPDRSLRCRSEEGPGPSPRNNSAEHASVRPTPLSRRQIYFYYGA